MSTMDNSDLMSQILCHLFPVSNQRVSFRMLWDRKKVKGRVTKEERLIEGRDGGKRGTDRAGILLSLVF